MSEQHQDQLSTADLAGTTRERPEDRLDNETIAQRGAATGPASHAPLFPGSQSEAFRNRWTTIQSGFVDEPRRAVENADSLIAEVMKALATSFADERKQLEQQWDRGADVSTEDLRLGLQRYRSFFDRLLSV